MDDRIVIVDQATCKHENARIREWFVSAHVFVLHDGVFEDMDEEASIRTGTIGLTCTDCDLDKEYPPGQVPDWLLERMGDIRVELAFDDRNEGW